MKKFKISLVTFLTAALTAMMAVGTVGVASASAALPEFVVTGGNTTFTGASKTGVKDILETVKGETVECNKDKSKGDISNGKANAITKVFVTFEECKGPLGSECGNKGSKTSIETNELSGTPVYATSARTTVLIDLNAVGTRFATFECVGIFGIKATLNVRGKLSGEKDGVLGLVPTGSVNKALTKSELLFRQANGVQEFTAYFNEAGTTVSGANLETESSGAIKFAFEQSGQQNEDELTSPVAVELKA